MDDFHLKLHNNIHSQVKICQQPLSVQLKEKKRKKNRNSKLNEYLQFY